MREPRSLFPLADALAKEIDPQIAGLVDGSTVELLSQVSDVTSELLRFWFQRDYCYLRQLNFHEGQRSAILQIIYAHEVVGKPDLASLYETVAPDSLLEGELLQEVNRRLHSYPKYAAKMATGTGKTWVLNALLLWQHLNHLAAPDDPRFTSNFLIVAPGLIVYDRLLDSFLGKEKDGERHFVTSDLHSHRDLFIPDNFHQEALSFVQSAVVTKGEIGQKVTGGGMIAITNWHLLAGVEDPDFVDEVTAPGEDVDPGEAVKSFIPLTPGTATGNALDVLDRRFERGLPLQSLKNLPDLMVFNDEAHHIHDVKKAGEATEVEWQKSLREIASGKGSRFIQVDFSATPYNQSGSGKNAKKRYFPHIAVDFNLSTAMNAGLVKTLALDKRQEVAALPLDFKAERDEQQRVTGLSHGQRVMLKAGLTKLEILESQFADTDPEKHPKLLVVCEDTSVTVHVVEFLRQSGLGEEDVLAVDSGRKAELGAKKWELVRERLFDMDRHSQPKVIVSVLMLREGFDVNNICVVVPLRATQAQILLEQTIGRGLRLMWRGSDEIDEMKAETRERFRNRQEPTNFFDILFIVEHPAFQHFYDDLIDEGITIGEIGESSDTTSATGDLEVVELREGFEEFDFEIPLLIREADEELSSPSVDPLSLGPCVHRLETLKRIVGEGDRFFSEDAATKLQYGDYRVDGGVMTATGYNDYLSRMTNRIAAALGSSITKSAKQYRQAAQYPFMQAYRPALVGWLDTYIRNRLFDQTFDPLKDENWRFLLIDDVANGIAGTFATALTDVMENLVVDEAQVEHRWLSEVKSITVRTGSCVEVRRCIYPKLGIPSKGGGLERAFIEWADSSRGIEALAKIHEYRHSFLHRPYLKADGMPSYYSPDFIVRTAERVYIVETKAQSALSDENVQRKMRAALNWCEQINRLDPGDRSDRDWQYCLIGQQNFEDHRSKGGKLIDLLELSYLRDQSGTGQHSLL